MRKTDQRFFDFSESLFEQICEMGSLRVAFRAAKKNKGAPGVDGMTLEYFEQNLEEELAQLRQEVLSWRYKPQPVKRVEIPKPNGGIRLLGIPTIRDRVLQTSIKMALEPVIDPSFSPNSYGFRPDRNQKQALEAAHKIVESGKEFVVDMDLSKFFDRINHDRLISRLKLHIEDRKVLRLIGLTLRCGILEDGSFRASSVGSVQGSPLSPLLSNVVLDELDKELEKRGLEFCRFADDCNIFVRSEKAANRVKESITKFIENKMKLVVNQEKTKVAKSKHVKFLGMTVLLAGLCISSASMSKAMETVKGFSARASHIPIEVCIQRFNRWYKGWSNYHEISCYPSQFNRIEAHFRRRLRAKILRDHKRCRYIHRKLVKRGLSKAGASSVCYSNDKTWAMSKRRGVHLAWPNRYFSQLGLYTHSDRKLLWWKSIKEVPKLT